MSRMDIEKLMLELAETGASALVKCDGERLQQGGDAWTFVVTGGPLKEEGPVRRDDISLESSLENGLLALRDRGPQWHWLDKYLLGEE
ncbi:hypothetical protein [Streptomyces boncukensis]|uniref:Uncharacterized protein n=1 Tax=Streptomyces boncukensis TaxID=2711219 RepID=A0A6G4X916_9ACTN|nr:hypothetical protein [Streptomyces boncukensis]NGO73652.1 hypothetical protein [Streptomyces boncukensis]